MSVKTCPIQNCTTPLKADRLLCWWHWQMVPADVQSRVWTTYRGLLANRRDLEAVLAYRAASDAAIELVNARIQVREFITQQEPQP